MKQDLVIPPHDGLFQMFFLVNNERQDVEVIEDLAILILRRYWLGWSQEDLFLLPANTSWRTPLMVELLTLILATAFFFTLHRFFQAILKLSQEDIVWCDACAHFRAPSNLPCLHVCNEVRWLSWQRIVLAGYTYNISNKYEIII